MPKVKLHEKSIQLPMLCAWLYLEAIHIKPPIFYLSHLHAGTFRLTSLLLSRKPILFTPCRLTEDIVIAAEQ